MEYTTKEKMIYTLIICFAMEFLMAYYNYFFHTSAFLDEAFLLACIEFIPAFVVGVICEWFIISRIAKKITKCLRKKQVDETTIIHVNEFVIATGMMCVISIFGMLYHSNELSSFFIFDFIVDFIKNGVVGIPLFMLVVSPFAQKLIRKMAKNSIKEERTL